MARASRLTASPSLPERVSRSYPVAQLLRRDDTLLERESREGRPLLMLRHVSESEDCEEGVEVELDRLNAHAQDRCQFAVGGRDGEARLREGTAQRHEDAPLGGADGRFRRPGGER